MTVEDIIKQVRWCIDKEATTTAKFEGSTGDDTYLSNIIKAKINDALRWVCLYADATLLGGSGGSSTDNPTIRSYKFEPNENDNEHTRTPSGDDYPTYDEGGTITLPYDYIRLIRARCSQWSRAVTKTIEEDSESYLEEALAVSAADVSTPKVAIIRDYPNKLELYPKPSAEDTIYLTIGVSPSSITIGDDLTEDIVPVPPKVQSAFLYYIAYLVMCAYGDSNGAQLMLGVAKAHIGGASDETDAG